MIIAPLTKSSPVLQIDLTRVEAGQLRQAAILHKTSPASLAKLAIRQLLAQVKAGAAPMIAPSTFETATTLEGWEQGSEGLTVISTDPDTPNGRS